MTSGQKISTYIEAQHNWSLGKMQMKITIVSHCKPIGIAKMRVTISCVVKDTGEL